jgi:hypothetical protein
MDRDVKATWAGNPIQALAQWIADWIYSMLQPSVVEIPDVTGRGDAWARHLLRMSGLRVRGRGHRAERLRPRHRPRQRERRSSAARS